MIYPYMCIKCRNILTKWEDAINNLNALELWLNLLYKHTRSRPRYSDMVFSTIDIVPLQYVILSDRHLFYRSWQSVRYIPENHLAIIQFSMQ